MLTFEGIAPAWSGDAESFPLPDLRLYITTEDELSTSTAPSNLGQGYRITSFSGTRNGVAITPVFSSADAFYSYGIDSYLYPGNPQLVGGAGLAYTTSDGLLFNLYGFTATFVNPVEIQWWEMSSSPSSSPYSPNVTFRGELTLAAVPEPTTTGMMLAGLAAVGIALRRRRA